MLEEDEVNRVKVKLLVVRSWVLAAMAVAGMFALSCASASAPAQATDATATAAPTEEQASDPEPTPISTATPKPASAPKANAEATPSPTATQASAPEPAATSTEVVDGVSPVDDCFGGVLSEDPLHCYVLEQAEAEGMIDILAMYKTNFRLYVSIVQDELSKELFRFSRKKSFAFIEMWPELVPKQKYGRFVDPESCPEFPGCYLGVVGSYPHPRLLLPFSYEHDIVLLVPGGEEGRRSTPGWAGWRRLWPEVASGTSGASGTSSTFDVSDVDMSNLPDATSEHGFAGGHGGGGVYYVQVKSPVPTDEAGLHALRKAVNPCYDIVGRCEYREKDGSLSILYTREVHTIEFIPVKYSWAELNRWAEILNRFAVSSGNTLGITGASVDWNRKYDNPETIRETIVVMVHGDHERAAEAMPELLPLLGIPVDAVGMVRRDYSTYD